MPCQSAELHSTVGKGIPGSSLTFMALNFMATAGSAVPLEYNLDGLNAISFSKGCYVGQELVARTHFQGMVRKRLMPITLQDEAASGRTREHLFSQSSMCMPAHVPILHASLELATAACNLSGDHGLTPSRSCIVDGHAFKRVK